MRILLLILLLIGNANAATIELSTTTQNIGVGTVAQNGNKLDVNGNIRATSFQSQATTAGSLQVYEAAANGTNYVALSAPSSISADKTFVLPSADGSSGQGIVTDGSGNLSFATIGGYWVIGNVGVNTTSNVGINSVNPGKQLDVVGTVRATAFIGDGSGLTGVSGSGGGFWAAGNVGINTTSNVGIGTVNPGKGLDIATNGMRVAGGSGAFTVANANVGLGTTNPGQVLDINGRWRTVGIGTTTAGTIMCFKADGTVGYCTGSVTGNACAVCN